MFFFQFLDFFCSSSFSCFSTEHFLSGQRSDSGKVVWWRHSHDSAAAASAQRILIHCLAFWCIFDMQKGIPALKNLTNYFNLFSTTDRDAGILRTDVSGLCVSAVCGDEERGMTSGVRGNASKIKEIWKQRSCFNNGILGVSAEPQIQWVYSKLHREWSTHLINHSRLKRSSIDYFNVQFFDPLLFALVPLGYIFLLGENTWCTGGDLIWHLHGFIM